MCIISNLRDSANDIYAVTDFLTAYRNAQVAMDAATKAMLAVTKLDLSPEDKRRYDRDHKQMKRLMREWNTMDIIYLTYLPLIRN
jgi:hypothetical protein